MDQSDFKIINITPETVSKYDLFCYKSKKKEPGYERKLKWFSKHFKEGLRIKLLLVREKKGFTSRGFIEYIPGEFTWRGIEAKGYMVIHCLWVVGRNKGKGYGTKLINECINDAQEMNGVAVVTSEKTWLSSKSIFIKNGFKKVGTVLSDFDLFVKRFNENASFPKFKMHQPVSNKDLNGFIIYKSDQCPYTYASMREIEEYAIDKGISLQIKSITNSKEAQAVPHPYGTYCIFLNGKLLSYRPVGKRFLLELEHKS
ncbi:MAG: GNAT family N-acetyltransferase [Candidatus Hodarchaeota archaeon]